jgi:YggT family protein
MYALSARLADPFLRPFQRVVPLIGGIDLSPLVLLLVLHILGMLLSGLQMSWMH